MGGIILGFRGGRIKGNTVYVWAGLPWEVSLKELWHREAAEAEDQRTEKLMQDLYFKGKFPLAKIRMKAEPLVLWRGLCKKPFLWSYHFMLLAGKFARRKSRWIFIVKPRVDGTAEIIQHSFPCTDEQRGSLKESCSNVPGQHRVRLELGALPWSPSKSELMGCSKMVRAPLARYKYF